MKPERRDNTFSRQPVRSKAPDPGRNAIECECSPDWLWKRSGIGHLLD